MSKRQSQRKTEGQQSARSRASKILYETKGSSGNIAKPTNKPTPVLQISPKQIIKKKS